MATEGAPGQGLNEADPQTYTFKLTPELREEIETTSKRKLNKASMVFAAMAAKFGDSVIKTLDEDISEMLVYKDYRKMPIILAELARNAFEAGAPNCQIQVTVDGQDIQVCIEDDGPGIENPNKIVTPKHGLEMAINFGKNFTLESRGSKWKLKNKKARVFNNTGVSPVTVGTRISFSRKVD